MQVNDYSGWLRKLATRKWIRQNWITENLFHIAQPTVMTLNNWLILESLMAQIQDFIQKGTNCHQWTYNFAVPQKQVWLIYNRSSTWYKILLSCQPGFGDTKFLMYYLTQGFILVSYQPASGGNTTLWCTNQQRFPLAAHSYTIPVPQPSISSQSTYTSNLKTEALK